MKNFIKLVGCILLCEAAGVVGSFFTVSAIPTWYAALNKPSFSPPNWIFGPVWITLYALMGIALFLVWQKGFKKPEVRQAVELFLAHLIINVSWSVAFFGLHMPLLAFFGILLLLVFIIVLIGLFYRLRPAAAYLLIPYLVWVAFASVLNFEIWRLN